MHEEEVNVGNVADEEGLVAGGGHVAGLLVGAEANLSRENRVNSLLLALW